MSNKLATPADILSFWRAASRDKWFEKDDAFDGEIRARFLTIYQAAAAGRLVAWEDDPEGAPALAIVLDQLPRNMFRGDARTYAADPLARAVVDRAIARGFDQSFPPVERRFFYLPFEHSENLADQERGVALCRAAGDEEGVKYSQIHADIIRRFGRFPHRNAVLGRTSTPEEEEFLKQPGSSF